MSTSVVLRCQPLWAWNIQTTFFRCVQSTIFFWNLFWNCLLLLQQFFFLFCSRVSIFWKLVIWIYRKEEKKMEIKHLIKILLFSTWTRNGCFCFLSSQPPPPRPEICFIFFFFLLGVGSIFLLLSRVARSFYLQAFDYFIFSLSTIFNTVHSVKYLFLFCSSL